MRNRLTFKGIVSRDFEWLQMILINRICVPDVPLKVFFLHIFVHIVFLNFKFTAVKLLLIMHLAFQISRLYFFFVQKVSFERQD